MKWKIVKMMDAVFLWYVRRNAKKWQDREDRIVR